MSVWDDTEKEWDMFKRTTGLKKKKKSDRIDIHKLQMDASAGKRAERLAMWEKVKNGMFDPDEFASLDKGKYKDTFGKEDLGNYGGVMGNMKAYFGAKKDKQLSPGLASQTIFRAGLGQNMAKATLLGKK